jgi:hypothetical protein
MERISIGKAGPANYGEVKRVDKLKSRKFWMAVVTAAVILINEGFEMDLPAEAIYSVAGIVITYILGQSAVDTKK